MEERLVKSKKRVREFGEVFTAEREVMAMCDLIPESVWENIGSKFLEPCCGNGNFIVEILRRKLERCKSEADVLKAYDSIYGIEIQQDNVDETQERMLAMCPDNVDRRKLKLHITCGNSLEIMKEMEEDNGESKLD